MFALSPHVRVFLASQPVDMRSGHDGLFAIVKGWGLDPFTGDLFAFVGKRGDRVKILVWHRGGFLLMYNGQKPDTPRAVWTWLGIPPGA